LALADIEQHKELLEPNEKSGFLYEQNNKADLMDKLIKVMLVDGSFSYSSAHGNFIVMGMNCQYQELNSRIISI